MVVRTVGCALALVLTCSGCEAVANFDPNKLNTDRTIGPVPIPDLDGSLPPRMPEAGQQDAAIPADEGDAELQMPDAQMLDAAEPVDAAPEADGGELLDAAPEADGGPRAPQLDDAATE